MIELPCNNREFLRNFGETMMCPFWFIVINLFTLVSSQLLQEWVNLQSAFRAMAYFPLAMSQINPTASTTTIPASPNSSPPQNIPLNPSGRWFDPAITEEIIRNNGGYELVISPLYKRFLAEVIDTVILFIVKILFFVVIMDFFDLHMYVN